MPALGWVLMAIFVTVSLGVWWKTRPFRED
jgi:hypothetical protein